MSKKKEEERNGAIHLLNVDGFVKREAKKGQTRATSKMEGFAASNKESKPLREQALKCNYRIKALKCDDR